VITVPTPVSTQVFKRKTIAKIVSGSRHSMILTNQGAYVLGCGTSPVLAMQVSSVQPFASSKLVLKKCPLKNIYDMFTGANHSFVLLRPNRNPGNLMQTEGATCYAWGANHFGQLGIAKSDANLVPNPTKVTWPKPRQIRSIAAGECHTIFLASSGEIYGAGMNYDGQLGITQLPGTQAGSWKCKEPRLVAFPHAFESLAASGHFNFGVTRDHRVFSWGVGANFVLGNMEERNIGYPDIVTDFFSVDRIGLLSLGGSHVLYTGDGGDRVLQKPTEVLKESSEFESLIEKKGRQEGHFLGSEKALVVATGGPDGLQRSLRDAYPEASWTKQTPREGLTRESNISVKRKDILINTTDNLIIC
jgi:alpha-tubulin suppressor-like RCC1 family protein